MKTVLTSFLVAFAANLVAEEAPKRLDYVKEGVYFWRSESRTNILELKNGRFRTSTHATSMFSGFGGLHNNPDVKPEPRFSSSLQSGDYTTNGGIVTFVTPGSPRRPFVTNDFTSMEYKGKVTLWNWAGVKNWDERKTIDPVNILTRTDRKPEEILEGK